MPPLKGTEASLFYVQCVLYLVSSSVNVSVFHIAWLDTFWKDLTYWEVTGLNRVGEEFGVKYPCPGAVYKHVCSEKLC